MKAVPILLVCLTFAATAFSAERVGFREDFSKADGWEMLALAVTNGGRAAEPGVLPPQAELIFEDRFEKPELDRAWKIKVGRWKVVDGALEAKGPDALLLLDKDAGPSMRLEYTARSDDPCDLSACLNLDASATRPSGVFFQFGGMHNKLTAVAYGNARLWEGVEPLIQKGVKHRVICERWGALARFFVDGKLLFHGVIPQAEPSRNAFAGLFIYKSGRIDDVKLYRFQGEPAGEILRAEPDTRVRTWLGFEDDHRGGAPKLPAGWSVTKGAGEANVVLMRDYKNSDPLPRWVDDHCLELALSRSGEPPRLEASFEGLENGLIEFEAFAEPEQIATDTGFALTLLDTDKRPALVLATDAQRRFYTQGPNGPTLLEPTVAYTGINPKPPLRFVQGRWFRVRVHFDAVRGRCTAALVNMYVPERSYNPFPATGHWFVFGKDVPFARAAEKARIAGLSLSLAGRGRLRVDNLYVIAPTNGLTVNGKDLRRPARELLATAEHPRHDPPSLFLYSLRETLGTQGQYGEMGELFSGRRPAVLKAAFAYNELLVDHAFQEAEARALLRARHALHVRSKPPAETAPNEVQHSLAAVATAERDLAGLYRTYLEAYLDGLNSERLTRDVAPAAERMRAQLITVQDGLTRARDRLGLKPPADPGRPQVRIEKGRYRTDAGLAFYFPQTNWLHWPEQDRLLRLDGCATIYGNNYFQSPGGHFINGEAFNTYASYFLRHTPQGRFLLADVVGVHSCYTLTPDWWLAKHAGDDDVFFCDPSGRVPLKGDNRWESDGRAQLNFWNADVKAAMQAMAGERAGYLAAKWPGRVMGWEVLQEAHSGAGFTQTGYNVSAKRAFRDRLRKDYSTIEVLNRRWGAKYGDFDEIQPPAPGSPLPSPLNYEFQRFRQEAYRDWIAGYLAAVKVPLPDVPAINRIVDIVPFPTDLV